MRPGTYEKGTSRLGRDEIIGSEGHTGEGSLFRERHTDSNRPRPCSSKATPSGERPLQAPQGFSGVSWCVGSKECNELRRLGKASAPDDSKRKRCRRLKFANQNKLQFFARIFARRYTAPELDWVVYTLRKTCTRTSHICQNVGTWIRLMFFGPLFRGGGDAPSQR